MTNLATKTEEIKRVPSVWIGCLASYNSGRLFGEWVEIPDDAEELREEIKRVLKKSPDPFAEEWAFMDNEYCPNDLGENPDLDKLCEYASLYKEHGEAVEGFCDIFGYEYIENFDDHYVGNYESFQAFADQMADDTMLPDCPENISFYFDYEKFANDLGYDYDHYTGAMGDCHVFTNH